jgi:hypothetical protein
LPLYFLKFYYQALSKAQTEAEMEFDVNSVKSKVAESFKQVEVEISEQVS